MRSVISMRRLGEGLVVFGDTCNVYALRRGDQTWVIDFGSGGWLPRLKRMGWPPVSHVFLTHHHADQCAGLTKRGRWPFVVHAPSGEDAFLERAGVSAFWRGRRDGGTPVSYSVLPRGLSLGVVQYDMGGFADVFVGSERVRFLHTPGHGRNALTIIIDHDGRQLVFCGDAAHAGATIHQPYHLEWDHWTGSGALAAWEGVERLANIRIDRLLPAHGPEIARPTATLQKLSAKLLAFYRAKGNIAPGEPDRYLVPEQLQGNARRLLPDLYQFGTNGFLLIGDGGKSLVVDPYSGDMAALDALLGQLPGVRVDSSTATHFHYDHVDAMPTLRKRFGARGVLHPWVAAPLKKLGRIDAPWLTKTALRPDAIMPVTGAWLWNRYEFRVSPFPGQTWWHCCFMATINGVKVFFGGDNFQPNTRWNATGGFSSFNGSRFAEGFASSAHLVLDWSPDVIVNGHNTYMRFSPSHFRKILRWSRSAERATRDLCPSGDLERDYYLHMPMRG